MLIKSKDFKNVCKTVLSAIDNSEISTLTETLELKTVNNFFAIFYLKNSLTIFSICFEAVPSP